MKELLILAGYLTFQGACVAPWLWFLLVGAVVYSASALLEYHERR